MFVNIQTPGITFAITGPWGTGPLEISKSPNLQISKSPGIHKSQEGIVRSRTVACLFAVALVASVRVATAAPITYQTPNLSLTPAASRSGALVVNGLSFFDEAEFADFWTFSRSPVSWSTSVASPGIRTSTWRSGSIEGRSANTDQFVGGPFGQGTFHSSQVSLGYIGFFDDLPGAPFGNPRATFVAPGTGDYTLAVVSVASTGNSMVRLHARSRARACHDAPARHRPRWPTRGAPSAPLGSQGRQLSWLRVGPPHPPPRAAPSQLATLAFGRSSLT